MRLIEILEILKNYNINEDYPVWAEHDVIGFNIDYDIISEDDKQSLEELGARYDAEYDNLVIYV